MFNNEASTNIVLILKQNSAFTYGSLIRNLRKTWHKNKLPVSFGFRLPMLSV